MHPIPPIHLSLCLVPGHIHGLGLIDQLRYFRYQFQRLGLEVSCANNRLRRDAINFVFGAHSGFDPTLREDYCCMFVNLEQLGAGAAQVGADYLSLLSGSAVIDYDARNLAAYDRSADEVPLAPILHAPYLSGGPSVPLAKRPIDLLFFGCMNARRRAWIDRIEATGRTVALFDAPLFGEERDAYIRMSKAVLNIHFYDACRFEQARVAHCLSLGTPVISERQPHTLVPPAFENSVLWVGEHELEQFFTEDFGSAECLDVLQAAVNAFERADPLASYADIVGFARGYESVWRQSRTSRSQAHTRLNIFSERDYAQGWLNVSLRSEDSPDLVLPLDKPIPFPIRADSFLKGAVHLAEGSVDTIRVGRTMCQCDDLATLMGNCLKLLREDGELHAEVPYGPSMLAWQDPTHLRAMNENSWTYFTEWFWRLGWTEHRFEIVRSAYLDLGLKPTDARGASYMQVVLRKVRTTAQERMLARTADSRLEFPEQAASSLRPAPGGHTPAKVGASEASALRHAPVAARTVEGPVTICIEI